MNRRRAGGMLALVAVFAATCKPMVPPRDPALDAFVLDYGSPVDSALQARLETLDAGLRSRLGIGTDQADVGVLDLAHLRLAMIHPDRIEYAASVAKVGILLAYFEAHREAGRLEPRTRRELGLMIKASSNPMAMKFSTELGLARIQAVLDAHGFYDSTHGGGIWVGKHYGQGGERIGDPVADHSHAATVRQLLRFYLLLEQGKLVSPEASAAMLAIFDSPEIPHDRIKFVQGLAGRHVRIRRKWGSWEDWLHDSAVIAAEDRHYVLVALTHHPRGDEYLVELARGVDDLMQAAGGSGR